VTELTDRRHRGGRVAYGPRPTGRIGPHGRCGLADGPEDPLIAGAAAEVAGEGFADLVVSGVRVLLEERFDRHHEAGRAEPALETVVLHERLLDRVQRAVGGGDALDGRDLRSVRLGGEDQAGPHGNAVDDDRAGAAHAVLAAEMGASEAAVLPQPVG
jgi:hypothetical protein